MHRQLRRLVVLAAVAASGLGLLHFTQGDRGARAVQAATTQDIPMPPPTPPVPPVATREGPLLSVSGRGTHRTAPDVAVIRLGAVSQEEDAREAQSKVNSVMRDMVDKLKEAGIESKDISTSGLNLSPVYSDQRRPQQAGGEPRIVGFRASTTVTVRVTDITKTGEAIDAGITAGANSIQGISFELADDADARGQALESAVRDARRKAQVMADAADLRVGEIVELQEGFSGGPIRPMPMMGRMAAQADAYESAVVEPGEVGVNANVQIIFRLEQ